MSSDPSVYKIIDDLSLINPYRGKDCAVIPRARASLPSKRLPIASQIAVIQRIISSLEYNFLPSTFFSLKKNRPLRSLMLTAQSIIQESLPIRCLEATFLAVYLTASLSEVERFPLAFKSVCGKRSFRHIVLVVRHKNMFGAIGLSRAPTLMDKPLEHPSLLDLLDNYAQCYRDIGHQLVSIKLGLYFSRDPLSRAVPFWRFISAAVPRCGNGRARSGKTNFGRRKTAAPTDAEQAPTVVPNCPYGSTPPDAASSAASSSLKSLDPEFVKLIDNFSEMLPAISQEYHDGGDSVNAVMDALRGFKLVAQPDPVSKPPRGRTLERAEPPLIRAPTRSAAARLRGLPSPAIGPAVDPLLSVLPVTDETDDVDDQDDDDDRDGSDTEDNAFRVMCVLKKVSPFRRGAIRRYHSEPHASSHGSQPPPQRSNAGAT